MAWNRAIPLKNLCLTLATDPAVSLTQPRGINGAKKRLWVETGLGRTSGTFLTSELPVLSELPVGLRFWGKLQSVNIASLG